MSGQIPGGILTRAAGACPHARTPRAARLSRGIRQASRQFTSKAAPWAGRQMATGPTPLVAASLPESATPSARRARRTKQGTRLRSLARIGCWESEIWRDQALLVLGVVNWGVERESIGPVLRID